MNIFGMILSYVIWAPGILHFEGLGMRNLQYEMRICQKSHNKVTKIVMYGSNFYGSDVLISVSTFFIENFGSLIFFSFFLTLSKEPYPFAIK